MTVCDPNCRTAVKGEALVLPLPSTPTSLSQATRPNLPQLHLTACDRRRCNLTKIFLKLLGLLLKTMPQYRALVKENERVMLYLPAADLDPDAFPNPEAYDLKRENKVQIAFNAGPYRCLGSHLARLELENFFEELLARLPRVRLDPTQETTFLCSHILGIDRLYLVWDVYRSWLEKSHRIPCWR